MHCLVSPTTVTCPVGPALYSRRDYQLAIFNPGSEQAQRREAFAALPRGELGASVYRGVSNCELNPGAELPDAAVHGDDGSIVWFTWPPESCPALSGRVAGECLPENVVITQPASPRAGFDAIEQCTVSRLYSLSMMAVLP